MASAKTDDSHIPEIALSGEPSSDPRVVFATYGCHEIFWDVTDLVKKLLRDNPVFGFHAHEDVMGGDPEYNNNKTILIIFEYNGKFYYLDQLNRSPKINTDSLIEAAKLEDALTAYGKHNPGEDPRLF